MSIGDEYCVGSTLFFSATAIALRTLSIAYGSLMVSSANHLTATFIAFAFSLLSSNECKKSKLVFRSSCVMLGFFLRIISSYFALACLPIIKRLPSLSSISAKAL